MGRVMNLAEVRASLSRLVEEVAAGEEIVIAKAGRPLVRLVPLERERPPRRLGLWKGRGRLGDDFDDPLPDELLEAFEGSDG